MAVPFSYFSPRSCLKRVGVSETIIHTSHRYKSALCIVWNVVLGIQFKNVRDVAPLPILWNLKRHLIGFADLSVLIMGRIGNHDTQGDTQDGTQGVPQDVTQSVPQDVPQDKELDDLLNEQILSNPQISTGDMAELSNRNSKNIKCQLAKCYMLVMSVVIRGHWEVLGKE